MKKMYSKHIFSLLLAVILVISAVVFPAAASEFVIPESEIQNSMFNDTANSLDDLDFGEPDFADMAAASANDSGTPGVFRMVVDMGDNKIMVFTAFLMYDINPNSII